MEANGKDDLKIPLLEPSDDVILDIQSVRNADQGVRTITFKIGGIECASCSTSIESVLQKLNGVESAIVSPLQGRAVVKYVPELVGVKAIKEAIEDAGFDVIEFSEQDIAVCRLRIKGMACTSCSESVERALSMVEGVKKAVVGLALEEAKVNYDPNVINTDGIIEAVEDAGFGAELIGSGSDGNIVHIKLEGIVSPEDMNAIKLFLESLDGVNHVEIDMEECKLTVGYDPDLTGSRSLIRFIQESGVGSDHYRASLYVPERRHETEKNHEIRMYRNQFLWSCLFSVPLLLFSMILPMVPPYGNWLNYKLHNMLTVGMVLRWLLCTPVQFIIGKRFYMGSYHALRRKSAT